MAEFNTLRELFEAELRDVYDAEQQILKTLPKVIEAAHGDDLREALHAHLEETRGHVRRLETVFEGLDMKVKGKHCAGMAGILEEGGDIVGGKGNEAVRDAGLIAGCQRVEHYEITAYGSLMAWAKALDFSQALALLGANEREEKAADLALTKIAERRINDIAAAARDPKSIAAEAKAVQQNRAH